ncbi:hypothetical protein [Streptomyces sp. NPDC020298]|uniref:hypothetical protein n=1 Tax=unclassified Streptomyces TaxID=2593676 RepID=UPI00340C8929
MVPEQYQKHVPPVGHRPVYPAEVELYTERGAVTWVPSAENPSVMVPVLKEYVQPMAMPAPRDLTPQPVLDPLAQRMLGGGLGAGAAGAGVGWGIGQAAAGIAAIGGTTAAVAALLLLVLARATGGRGQVHIHQEVHNTARWFGRNTTNM